jgi:type IV pilus assembly protein PilA
MNSNFKFKLLSHLTAKKENKGFTLIELLVVVIIIGVLAAIALPNLLGQVGKARESEAKSTIGALNRAQQGYFTEKADWAGSTTQLEVPTTGKYYNFAIAANAVQTATGLDNPKNGTRNYTGGVSYNTNSRTFGTVVCRATDNPGYAQAGSGVMEDEGTLASTSAASLAVSCTTTASVEEVK